MNKLEISDELQVINAEMISKDSKFESMTV